MATPTIVLISCFMLLLQGGHATISKKLISHFKLELAAGKTVKEGGACKVDKYLTPLPPYCGGGVYTCVVDKVPANSSYSKGYGGTMTGHCNANYMKGHYCLSNSIPFSVGAKHIISSTCVSCTCTYHATLPYFNKARCDCEPLPACYMGYGGNPAGKRCPEPQTECLISRVGVTTSKNGYPIDVGSCYFPDFSGRPVCVSLGQDWGPKFYRNGTKNVPYPTDRCSGCTCAGGDFVNCKKTTRCLKQ